MKKLRIFIILLTASLLGLALFSCNPEEVDSVVNCNCIKEHYEIEVTIYNGTTFIDHVLTHSETVICQSETQNIYTGDDTYYKIVCDK